MADPIAVPDPARERRTTWRLFGLLLAGGLIGALGILPYSLELNREALSRVPAPLWIILVSSAVQNLILIAVVTGLGLRMAGRTGLGAPKLRAWVGGEPGAGAVLRADVVPALIAGAASAVVIAMLDLAVFSPRLPVEEAAGFSPPLWMGFLASFYGGIVEELLLRLGVMTFFAWVGALVTRRSPPSAAVLWSANLLAAVLFGLGHLPATAQLFPITPLVVARAVLLNGIPGVVFGWLYWRRGLFAAMTAHFGADLVLKIVLPMALR